jgi:uncharacterized protein
VALLAINLFLQYGLGLTAVYAVLGGSMDDQSVVLQGILLAMLPAAAVVAFAAWQFARLKGGNPVDVLNLRLPGLRLRGWLSVVAGFIAGIVLIFTAISLILTAFGFDPNSGGLVENAMADLSSQAWIYVLVLPSIVLGAPISEELIFRGQLFSGLANTRAGFLGASLITSLGWSMLHYSGNWLWWPSSS